MEITPRRHLLSLALVALAVGAAYANALDDGFVWDDIQLIEQDERIRSFDDLHRIFSQDFFEHANSQTKYGYYRPLVTLSYLLDRSLWGLSPGGFHFTNLILHWLCCAGVYVLALRVIGVVWEAALAAAVLFAVHPVHTESVTWISGRTDVLATLLLLVAWLLHEQAVTAVSAVRRRARLAASAVVFLLALLAKESALALPILLLVVALGRTEPRRALVALIPHGLAVAFYAVLRFVVVGVPTNATMSAPILLYLASASKTLWRYVGELVWPFPLSAYIQNPWVGQMSPIAWVPIAATGALVGLLVVFWRRRWITPLRMVLAFGVALVPHANLVHISGPPDMGFIMAERFLYLPSVFFCIGIGALAFSWRRGRVVALVALSIVAVGSTVAVARRNLDWRDEGTFMSVTIQQAPDAPLLHSRLGAYQSLREQHAAAVKSFQLALDLHRRQAGNDSPPLVLDLASALRRAGDPRTAYALLEPLVALGYHSPPMLLNLGETLRLLGRNDEARKALLRCVQADPSLVGAYLSLSRVEAAGGRFEEALANYRSAVDLFPDDAGLHLWGGDLERMRGDLDAAERMYRRALVADPRFARAEAALAALAAERGQPDRARAGFTRALQLAPDLHEARVGLALLHARAGDFGAAERELAAVLDLAPDNVDALLAHAALLSRAGRAAEARESARRALRLDPANARARQMLDALSAPARAQSVPGERAR